MRTKSGLIAFNSGEFDEDYLARVDQPDYEAGAAEMVNVLPLISGGMTKAPGTHYVGSSPADGMIYPFVFSQEESFGLLFTPGQIRFYAGQGSVALSGGAGVPAAFTDATAPTSTGGGTPTDGGSGTGGGVYDPGLLGGFGGGGGWDWSNLRLNHH